MVTGGLYIFIFLQSVLVIFVFLENYSVFKFVFLKLIKVFCYSFHLVCSCGYLSISNFVHLGFLIKLASG